MNVRYEPTKDDTRASFDHCWSKVPLFRRRLFIFGGATSLLFLAVNYAALRSMPAVVLAIGIVIAATFPWTLRWILLRRTKSGVRTLSIDRDGIDTQIGSLAGQVPWRDVLRVDETERHIVIIGRNLNSFAIPSVAFNDRQERDEFLRRAQSYLANAT